MYIPTFPDQNDFLTKHETTLILLRVERDRGDSAPDILTRKKLLSHLTDWKVWVTGAYSKLSRELSNPNLKSAGLMFMCATLPAYAIRYLSHFLVAWCERKLPQLFYHSNSCQHGMECVGSPAFGKSLLDS